jgi:predicted DNA-binding protein (UPF0251 family)
MTGETEKDVSGWTVDTLRADLLMQIEAQQASTSAEFKALIRLLDERYSTQTKAVDAAFIAQQTAMRTALEAAEKAVQTALLSAKEAVVKAEVAADKRFESTNEFRGQLNDMVATLMGRMEADAKFGALDARVSELAGRMDLATGRDEGAAQTVVTRRLDAGQLIAVLGVLLAAVIVGLSLYAATH